MNSSPRISVALCTHNGERYIQEQLTSIAAQTHPIHELIVCDDVSKDRTAFLITALAAKYNLPLTLHTNTEHTGVNKNFEQALSKCTGDIILLCDQDDVWHPNKVKTIVDYFDYHPEKMLVCTNANLINSNGNTMNRTLWDALELSDDIQKRWEINHHAFEDILNNGNKITGATIALKKELLAYALPFSSSHNLVHDAWLAMIAALVNGLGNIPVSLMNYRVHGDQLIGIGGAGGETICTIIAPNYLPFARSLAESFYQHHPSGRMFVLLIGDMPKDASDERFTIIPIQHVPIPEYEAMKKRYTIRELCTAVKPFFLLHLLQTYQLKFLSFLDPDIRIYAPLTPVFRKLEQASVVLTPHILGPIDEDFLPNEFSILEAGIYNLGFIGVANTTETHRFLRWWGDRLILHCHGAPHIHEHFDQRWIDLVPGFIERVAIERNPGMNVAYWDLSNRHLSFQNNTWNVNGTPLRFFHFSGYSPDEPQHISKYQNRFTFADVPELLPLFTDYRESLIRHGYIVKDSPTPQPRVAPTTTFIGSMGPRAYRKLTSYLAGKGLEPLLTSLIGTSTIGAIRRTFFALRFRPTPIIRTIPKQGVNVIGFLSHATGVAVAAHAMVNNLTATSVPVTSIDIESHRHVIDRYPISIIHANADVTQDVIKREHIVKQHNKLLIGYWWWEMAEFPQRWSQAFSSLTEIWVGSTFVQQAISSVSPIPVRLVPLPASLPHTHSISRLAMRLPSDKYIFLFVFDARSYVERKNPYAIIKAFKKAFPHNNDAILVIKVSHAIEFQQEVRKLKQALQEIGGILVDSMMTQEQVSTVISLADAYISLHRSEGFGLTMTEAMLHAKPVIATGYSGNMDYMTLQNSYPVDYQLIPLAQTVGPYQKGMMWAEPNIEHAAQLMRFVYEHRQEAHTQALQGQADIMRLYGLERTTQELTQHLLPLFDQLHL